MDDRLMLTATRRKRNKYIAKVLKAWLVKITAISPQQARTRLSMTPNSPKTTEKREKRERMRERGKKRLEVVVCLCVDLRY